MANRLRADIEEVLLKQEYLEEVVSNSAQQLVDLSRSVKELANNQQQVESGFSVQSQQVAELSHKVDVLESSITITNGKVAEFLTHTNNVLSNVDTMTSVWIFWATVIITIVSIVIPIVAVFLSQKAKREALQKAREEQMERFVNDEDFREAVLGYVIENKTFQRNVDIAMKAALSDGNGAVKAELDKAKAGLDTGEK